MKSLFRGMGWTVVLLFSSLVFQSVFPTALLPRHWVPSFLAHSKEEVPTELAQVGIDEHLGAAVDLSLTFRNEKGELVPLRTVVDGRRPTLLFLVYYSCPNLCNYFLNGSVEVLKKLSWTPGKEFQILTVTMDPREEWDLGQKKKENYLKLFGRPEAREGWHFWVDYKKGKPEDHLHVKDLAEQVGFRYRFDAEQNQYAHTAAMIVLTPDGRISRYLYGIDFSVRDLRLALLEASDNKIGNVMDRLLLFCYHYDSKTKKYSLFASNLMRAAGALTTFVMGLFLLGWWRRERRRGHTEGS